VECFFKWRSRELGENLKLKMYYDGGVQRHAITTGDRYSRRRVWTGEERAVDLVLG